MPYKLSLQSYTLPEFEALPPDTWERRLREISPVLPNTAHLGFRKFAPRDDWKESPFNAQPGRPLWAIYTRLPIRLVEPLTAEGYRLHWSEHFDEGEQIATRALVSDYQHFMWHTRGLYVQPLWLLQGEWGGTPTKFTKRETRILDATGQDIIPAPPGTFTPCVFDERVVRKVLERDRLVQAGNRFDELEKMNRPEAKKAEDDAAEMLYRETVLEQLSAMVAPEVEFFKSQIGKREIEAAVRSSFIPEAPKGLPNVLATWKDVFRSTGVVPGATAPTQKQVPMLVN